MPISNTSRYFAQAVYEADDAQGVSHPTVAIRPSTSPPQGAMFYQHPITGVDNIEYLAWQYYGSSETWWRIAEANELRFPLDWAPGMAINIPTPGDVGRTVRTRRF